MVADYYSIADIILSCVWLLTWNKIYLNDVTSSGFMHLHTSKRAGYTNVSCDFYGSDGEKLKKVSRFKCISHPFLPIISQWTLYTLRNIDTWYLTI